jgi:hypothetical protein
MCFSRLFQQSQGLPNVPANAVIFRFNLVQVFRLGKNISQTPSMVYSLQQTPEIFSDYATGFEHQKSKLPTSADILKDLG